MAKPKNLKGGRPLKVIDELLLEKLTKLHLSEKVIADILCVHVDTLRDRFSNQMDEWRSRSKGKIAEVLFDEGVNKREPWALKALAQKHLDYYDKKELIVAEKPMEKMSDDQLEQEIQRRLGESK